MRTINSFLKVTIGVQSKLRKRIFNKARTFKSASVFSPSPPPHSPPREPYNATLGVTCFLRKVTLKTQLERCKSPSRPSLLPTLLHRLYLCYRKYAPDFNASLSVADVTKGILRVDIAPRARGEKCQVARRQCATRRARTISRRKRDTKADREHVCPTVRLKKWHSVSVSSQSDGSISPTRRTDIKHTSDANNR